MCKTFCTMHRTHQTLIQTLLLLLYVRRVHFSEKLTPDITRHLNLGKDLVEGLPTAAAATYPQYPGISRATKVH